MVRRKLYALILLAIIVSFPISASGQTLGFFGDRHVHFEFGNTDQFAVRTRTGVLFVNFVSALVPPTVLPVLTPSGEPITDVVEVETHRSFPTMYFISTLDHVYAADSSEATAIELRAREIVTPDGSPIAGALQVEHRGGGRGVLFIRTASNVYATDFFSSTETQFYSREVVKPDGSSIGGSLAMAVQADAAGFVAGIISASDGIFGSDPLNVTEREVFTREIVTPAGDPIRGASLLAAAMDPSSGLVVAVAANDEGVFGSDPTNFTSTQLFTRQIVKPNGSAIANAQSLMAGGVGPAPVAVVANPEGLFGSDPLNFTPTALFTREVVTPSGRPIAGVAQVVLVSTTNPALNVVIAANSSGVFGSDPYNFNTTQLFTKEIVKPSGASIAGANLLAAMVDGSDLAVVVAATPGGVFGFWESDLNSTPTTLFTREIVTPDGSGIYGGRAMGLGLDGNGIVVAVVATRHAVYGSDPLNFTQTQLFTREILKTGGLPIRGVTHIGFLPTPVLGAAVAGLRSPAGLFMTDPANSTSTQLFTQEITFGGNSIEGFHPGEIATPARGRSINPGRPFALIWGQVPGDSRYELRGLINGSPFGRVNIGAVDELRVDSSLSAVLPVGLYELQVIADDFRGFTYAAAPSNFTIGSSDLSPRSPSPPEITAPLQGAELNSTSDVITVNWTAAPGAINYRITAAHNGLPLVRNISLGLTTQIDVPARALNPGFYEVQIIAETIDGLLLASEVTAFRVR